MNSRNKPLLVKQPKELKVSYSQSSISDEAKRQFIESFNELEDSYLELKQKLAFYLARTRHDSK